jgi:long-chain acyl-CoA synthetase
MNTIARKPWLSQYPVGVPAEIDLSGYTSLVDLLETAFREHAPLEAASFMEQSFRYQDIDSHSMALGAWLQSLGLPKGARVALMMPNVPQYLVAIAAVLRAGYTVVNVNPLYTPRELEHQLKDSGSDVIIILENFAHTLAQVIDHTPIKHVILAAMGDMLAFPRKQLVNFVVRHVRKLVPAFDLPSSSQRQVIRFNTALAQGQHKTLTRRAIGLDDIAFLQYTGGTTGVSKGAVLLHRNVLANTLQCEAWFRPRIDAIGHRHLTMVCALPLYHIFALTICYFIGCRLGCSNVLIPNPRDIPGLVKTLSKHRINMFPAVNTLFNALVNHPDFAKLDFSGLKVCFGGGMSVQKATADQWFKLTGCPIVEGYGLSETSPVATANRLDISEYSGTIGVPISSTEVVLRDDGGNDVALGQPGEICIRGPQVMAGYWNRDDETAHVMSPDGYFKSGDIGVMDENGYVRIVDRKKDMILVSGFNVYPNEIEQVVNLHPGVLECAVVGVPDEHSGEAVRLVVVKRDPSLTAEALAAYCKENFTAYKRPRKIEFRDALPKSNVGKILRRELR